MLLSALVLRPGDAAILDGIGNAYFGKKEYARAVEYLAKAAASSSVPEAQRAEAYHTMGLAYNELENLRAEAAALTNAVTLAEDDTPWLTDALYMLGDAHWRLNNASGAKSAWKRYLARSPTNAVEVNAVRRRLLQYN